MNLIARFAVLPFCLAIVTAQGEEPVAAIGRQRAADSPIQWETRDLSHPRMGDITVAVPTGSIVTPAGSRSVASLAFVSCEKATRKIAIELANASSPDDPGGMRRKTMPRLVCNSPSPKGDMAVAELATSWYVNDLGDALARGFSPAALRRCATIDVVQEVLLPPGWGKDSARIQFEIAPYGKELDAVFSTCGEAATYVAAEPAPRAAPPAPPPTRVAEAPWKPARTTPRGKTNIRAGPSLESPVVTMLGPGENVLVQWSGTEWWKVKPRTGSAYLGYIRQDRLVFN